MDHYILAGLLTLGLVAVAMSRLVSFTDLAHFFTQGRDQDSMRSKIDKERDIFTLGCFLVFFGIPAGIVLLLLCFY